MKPLLFVPVDGSLTRGRTASIEDNLLQSRIVSSSSSKGKYPDPRPDGKVARAGRRCAKHSCLWWCRTKDG